MSDPVPNRKSGHALPVLALGVGVIVLLLMTQHAISGAVARFIGGLWVSVLDVVLRLTVGIFGG